MPVALFFVSVASAAAGAAASWTLARRKMEGALREAKQQGEQALGALREQHQRAVDALSELREQKLTVELSLADLRGALEAARAEVRAAQAESESAREAVALVRREAALEAERSARTQLEGALAAREAELRRRAREEVATERAELERGQKELAHREERLEQRERAVSQKDELVTRRELELTQRDRALGEREQRAQSREKEADKLLEERRQLLEDGRRVAREATEKAAGYTAEEARDRLAQEMLDSARQASAREARSIEELAKEEAEKRAKRIVGLALQRYAGDYASERAVTTVHLPNDELKGRIIGREGRNIRAFQEATGCDLVVDDTPETIVVSAFDPIKREVARLTLEKLIADGRIHPSKIEECVLKARDEVERSLREAADQAVVELGVGRVHPEVLRLVGMLKYRYSYAQNVLRHSVEVGYLAGLIGAELGLNVKQARRAGFLHDIGKALTHEVEGGHAVIGGQYARKHGEDEAVANAIASHHEDEAPKHTLAYVVMAADAISGARPGARREMLENYVKRLEDLEKICQGFKGVEKTYALQAGREVRVFVEPSEVDDLGAASLSRDIARRIESELAYPGQIRVTVVRETRAVDYAR